MDKIINLTSRYKNVETTAEQIDDTRAIIKSNSHYITCNHDKYNNDKITSIDFEGGPMLYLEDELFGKKIKSFKSCFIIELE